MKTKFWFPRGRFTTSIGFFISALCMLAPIQSGYAHNKVVVVPMAGDDVVVLEPSTPVANVDTNADDYELRFDPGPTVIVTSVFDKTTKLEWQRGSGPTLNWYDAWEYCDDLNLRNKFDWRLPSVLELQSIVDYGSSNPAIDTATFPEPQPRYWSSTTAASNPLVARWVGFSDGSYGGATKASSSLNNVRCVR